MKIEAQEDDRSRKGYMALMASSGAANTAFVEDEHFYFVHGGRHPEAFELGADSTFVVCIGISPLKKMSFEEWGRCVWRSNKFGRVILSASHLPGRAQSGAMHSGIALSRPNVDEPATVEKVSDAASSLPELRADAEFETFPWRGTYCVAHTQKVLFSQNVEFKTSDLPRWKPRVILDRDRL